MAISPEPQTTFTTAPWTLDYVVDGAFQISGTVEGDKCILALRPPFPERHAEFVQNATLMTLAPELYEALTALRACFTSMCRRRDGVVLFGHSSDDLRDTLTRVDAILTKVEGR